MISKFTPVLFVVLCLVSNVRALEVGENKELDTLAKDYLMYIATQQWDKSAPIIAQESLQSLKASFLSRLRGAPVIDAEKQMLKAVGLENEKAVVDADLVEFYKAYMDGLQTEFRIKDETVKQVSSTLKTTLLSVGKEGDDRLHYLVRRVYHRNTSKGVTLEVTDLEIVSMINENGKWKISLTQKGPMHRPIETANP